MLPLRSSKKFYIILILPKTFPYSCIFDITAQSVLDFKKSFLLIVIPPGLALLPVAPRNCTCKFILTPNKVEVEVPLRETQRLLPVTQGPQTTRETRVLMIMRSLTRFRGHPGADSRPAVAVVRSRPRAYGKEKSKAGAYGKACLLQSQFPTKYFLNEQYKNG